MFYTYVDETHDGKPFYVGMGDEARLRRLLDRNKRHTHTAKKHGQNRQVLGEFENRDDAIQLEIKLITELHTFVDDPDYNGVGCNYTRGGEGCPCSEETRKKISESRKGKEPWNKGKHVKYNLTDEDREHRRQQLIAYNKTRPNLGKKHTDEALAKMRKPHRCSNCGESGHQKRTCQKLPGLT